MMSQKTKDALTKIQEKAIGCIESCTKVSDLSEVSYLITNIEYNLNPIEIEPKKVSKKKSKKVTKKKKK